MCTLYNQEKKYWTPVLKFTYVLTFLESIENRISDTRKDINAAKFTTTIISIGYTESTFTDKVEVENYKLQTAIHRSTFVSTILI